MATLERVIQIAVEAHWGQTDKTGAPYILHPLRVMMSLESETERIVAVLHDVVEKSPWTISQLKAEGFSEQVLEAVECVTRSDDESYDDFVERNKTNSIGRRVRIADIEDKLDVGQIDDLTDEQLQRLQRYQRAWRALSEG